jgi:hypothetical protein
MAMRSADDYFKLSRSPLLNHLRTENKKSPPGNQILDFITKRLWSWLFYYLKSRFLPKYPYPDYPAPETGIYPLHKEDPSGEEPVTIAVVADWGTDTLESIRISGQMAKHRPDYTVHLGDTYFVGAPPEIEKNFTSPGSAWCRGKIGSFALLGNHEMYAQGIAFFKELLPSLGIRNKSSGIYDGQKAGFFCLENEHWRILGLDTGYHSIGRIPLAELIFTPDCRLDDILIQWLREKVRLDDPDDKRGLLILTHHQYISSFKSEGEFQKPASQLAALIGKQRPVLWLWGHEHKFSIFEKTQVKDGITAYGRCMGHGGMPVEIKTSSFVRKKKARGYSRLVMVDERQKPGTEQYPLGYNGYALIKIKGDELRIGYYDIQNFLLEETWKASPSGEISGKIKVDSNFDQAQKTIKNWEDAVK